MPRRPMKSVFVTDPFGPKFQKERVPEDYVKYEFYPNQCPAQDELDKNLHPNYAEFVQPYEITCRYRITRIKKKYERQFQKEINNIIAQQLNAFDAMRFTKYLSITSFWPPLHTHYQINNTHKEFFMLPQKDQERLNFLLSRDIN